MVCQLSLSHRSLDSQINLYPNTEIMFTELQETQTGILKSKMMELQSALLFTDSASLVKLPTHVISDISIDEEGQIWFVIPKPAQHIDAFDKEMPAKLDFFKKGRDFFVKVRGTASFATAAELSNNKTLSADMQERIKEGYMIAMKVMVQDSELVDNSPKPSQSWLRSSRSQLSSWFF